MRPIRRPRSAQLRLVLAAGALAVAAGLPGAAGAASVPRAAALFDTPSAIGVDGAWLVVANQANGTLTVLTATGALAGRVGNAFLGIGAPDSIATATLGAKHVVFVAGGGGAVAELSITAKGSSIVVAKLHTLRPKGCAKGTATLLASDGAGHLVVACANGTVTEWAEATAMLLRQYGPTRSGLTNVTGVAVLGQMAFLTNAATKAAGSAPDGVVELSLTSAHRVHAVTNANSASYGFSAPDGIASDGTHLWVSNAGADTVDELSASRAAPLAFLQSSGTNLYNPGVVLASSSFVWVSSVDGPGSSMVTQFNVAPHTISAWMMCNSNDQYHFDNPSGFAVSGTSLWVVNAANNLLDQMNSTSGRLLKTYA